MVRTQIQLTEAQVEKLRRLSADTGRSMADLIREAVDAMVDRSGEDRRWRRALAALGRYRSDAADIAANHDRYLDEAYDQS